MIVEVNEKIVNGVRDVLDAIGLEVGKSLEFRVRKRSGDIKSVRVITAPEK